jgi:hypothetical protein
VRAARQAGFNAYPNLAIDTVVACSRSRPRFWGGHQRLVSAPEELDQPSDPAADACPIERAQFRHTRRQPVSGGKMSDLRSTRPGSSIPSCRFVRCAKGELPVEIIPATANALPSRHRRWNLRSVPPFVSRGGVAARRQPDPPGQVGRHPRPGEAGRNRPAYGCRAGERRMVRPTTRRWGRAASGAEIMSATGLDAVVCSTGCSSELAWSSVTGPDVPGPVGRYELGERAGTPSPGEIAAG